MNNQAPSVPVHDVYVEPLEGCYRVGSRCWSVARLVELSKDLPVFEIPLAGLNLSECAWDGCNMVELAAHVWKVMNADCKHPVLIAWDGRIADGRHRIIQALVEGKTHISARRLMIEPSPDRIDPDD